MRFGVDAVIDVNANVVTVVDQRSGGCPNQKVCRKRRVACQGPDAPEGVGIRCRRNNRTLEIGQFYGEVIQSSTRNVGDSVSDIGCIKASGNINIHSLGKYRCDSDAILLKEPVSEGIGKR